MADDLKQRLRMFAGEPVLGGVIEEAADRIEELELVIATDTGTEGAVANLQGRVEEPECE